MWAIWTSSLILRSNLNCKLIWYFVRIFSQISTWINVMVTLDRMLCVYSLSIYRDKLTNKNIITSIFFCLLLAVSLINAPNLFFYLDSQTHMCIADSNLVPIMCDAISVFMIILVPFILQLVLNSMLIHKLYKTRPVIRMPVL